MSAYAEYRHGIITYDQYRAACMMEEYFDRMMEERMEERMDMELEEEDGGDDD